MLAGGRSKAFAWGSSIVLGAATLLGVMTMAVTNRRRHGIAGFGGGDDLRSGFRLVPEVIASPESQWPCSCLSGLA